MLGNFRKYNLVKLVFSILVICFSVCIVKQQLGFLLADANDETLKKATLGKRENINSIVENLSLSEAENVLSRLTYGQMNHLSFNDLKARGESLKPGVDGVIEFAKLPEPLKELERIIGSGREFLPAHFLVVGAQRQGGVGRIRLKKAHNGFPPGSGWGSCFLVSQSMIMTNNHVVKSKEFAKTIAKVQFNFQNDLEGNQLPIDEYDLDPDNFYYTNADLDFTIVRIKPNTRIEPSNPNPILVIPGQNWGIINLNQDIEFAIGQRVNIIQHPNGRHKEIVLHENQITDVYENFMHYKADTEPGSSGSPVFDNMWRLIALHHSGGQKTEDEIWLSNEGVRIDKIIADIKKNAKEVVDELGL